MNDLQSKEWNRMVWKNLKRIFISGVFFILVTKMASILFPAKSYDDVIIVGVLLGAPVVGFMLKFIHEFILFEIKLKNSKQ